MSLLLGKQVLDGSRTKIVARGAQKKNETIKVPQVSNNGEDKGSFLFEVFFLCKKKYFFIFL
jgi:hypothetical protein